MGDNNSWRMWSNRAGTHYDNYNNRLGTTDKDGFHYDNYNNRLGRTGDNGVSYDNYNNRLGWTDKDGVHYDNYNNRLGWTNKDGVHYDNYNNRLGRTKYDTKGASSLPDVIVMLLGLLVIGAAVMVYRASAAVVSFLVTLLPYVIAIAAVVVVLALISSAFFPDGRADLKALLILLLIVLCVGGITVYGCRKSTRQAEAALASGDYDAAGELLVTMQFWPKAKELIDEYDLLDTSKAGRYYAAQQLEKEKKYLSATIAYQELIGYRKAEEKSTQLLGKYLYQKRSRYPENSPYDSQGYLEGTVRSSGADMLKFHDTGTDLDGLEFYIHSLDLSSFPDSLIIEGKYKNYNASESGDFSFYLSDLSEEGFYLQAGDEEASYRSAS